MREPEGFNYLPAEWRAYIIALKGKGASQGAAQVPAHMTGIFQQSVATNTTNPARDCATPPDEQKG